MRDPYHGSCDEQMLAHHFPSTLSLGCGYREDQGSVFHQRNQFDRVRRKGKVRWAADILRHSYASYHLARHEDAAKTSLQLGHRDTDVLFNHYRDLVMRKDAEAFWGIEPKKGSGIIRMRALA